MAEHLTFNQGVPSSNLGWVTILEESVELHDGEVSERFKEPVLKTGDSERGRGFESHPLRQAFRCMLRRSTQEAEEDGLLNR